MIDIKELARSLGDAAPAGPDLEGDPDTLALDLALRAKSPEPDAIAGDAVEWRDVRVRAIALLERSRDLRIATRLAGALLMAEGLAGLADGIDLIERLCRDLWPHVHPLLDAEDHDDPTMRMNALTGLAHFEGLPRLFRTAPWLTAPGFGPIKLRDVEIALGALKVPDGEPVMLTPAQVEGILATEIANGTPDDAGRARERVIALGALLTEKVGSQAPGLRPVVARLKPLADLYARAAASAGGQPSSSAPTAGAAAAAARSVASNPPGTAGAHFAAAGPGVIDSRDSAVAALERVCRYIEEAGPADPAPLLIRRAQKLIRMNFLDIIRELAPEGMDSIVKIAGIKEQDD